jgi:8-oxo-dGTP pyrophosphatase MutT (NUDIX family)
MRKLKSCGILVFTEHAERRSFLLMKHPDRLDLPKGHVNKGESEMDCAFRELREETGITRDQIRIEPGFRFELTYHAVYKRFAGEIVEKTVVIFLGWLTSGDVEISPSEHGGFSWFDWDPPHRIQQKTIDPLLSAVQRHFQS